MKEKIEKVYALITNEEDARICKDISDDACKYVPSNFFLIIISNTLTKIGDALSNPKTVLAWLMAYVNAPLYLVGFQVPIRESGSMLPQIVIASYVRQLNVRKWIWVIGSIIQFLSITGIGIVALMFKGQPAGWLIIILLTIFSLARGLSSVSSKDVLGKTIPKTRRGRLGGLSSSISGVLVLLAGLFITYKSNDNVGVEFYGYLTFFAGAMWLIGAIVYSFIIEYPGETSGGGNALKEAISRMGLLKQDNDFRNFVIARSLLLCSALTAPFYIIIAQKYLGTEIYILGLFIIANGIASSVSAPIWGSMADKSSKKVMTYAALITAFLGIIVSTLLLGFPSTRNIIWIYPLAFFILGIAHSGVRLGRKTYIVDMAGGNKRTDYVAVSNTVIGIILLITGGISALISIFSTEIVILILSSFGLLGAFTSFKLPEVE